jgi:hypothetical protein
MGATTTLPVLALVLSLLALAATTALWMMVRDAAARSAEPLGTHAVSKMGANAEVAAKERHDAHRLWEAIELRQTLSLDEQVGLLEARLRSQAAVHFEVHGDVVGGGGRGKIDAAPLHAHSRALYPARSANVAATPQASASPARDAIPDRFLTNPIYEVLLWPTQEQGNSNSRNLSSSGGGSSGGGSNTSSTSSTDNSPSSRRRRRGVPTAADEDFYCQFLLYRTRKAPPPFCTWFAPACTFPVLVTGLAAADLHETAVILNASAAVEVTDRGPMPVRQT